MDAKPTVTAIVLAYKNEDWLPRCAQALLNSEQVTVDVVLVDNGHSDTAVTAFADQPGVTVVGTGTNLGFTGGCNLGATHATGDYLALVNGDAIVTPTALARLVDLLDDPTIGIAAAAIRTEQNPDLLNSRGNTIHILGLSWVDGLGESDTRTHPTDVAGAMGTCVLMRRSHWDTLGGFYEPYFAYHEDAEISLRTWQLGLRVVNDPHAIVHHHYEFSRNPHKFYLSERNRIMFVLTLWGRRSLILLAPPLLALEAAMLLYAARNGWAADKMRGWTWIWRHRRAIIDRRRALQTERAVPDRTWTDLLATRVDTDLIHIPTMIRTPLNALTTAYWRLVRRFI